MKETENSIYTKGLSIVLRHLVQNHVNVNEHPENFEFPQFLSGKHLLFFQTNQYYLINALLCILNWIKKCPCLGWNRSVGIDRQTASLWESLAHKNKIQGQKSNQLQGMLI